MKNPLIKAPALCAAALAVMLGACATTTSQPTTEALYRAENSIRVAEQQQAGEFAALELESARGKLSAAQQAAASNDERVARERAEEAKADADLAAAKSDLSQTLKQAGTVQTNINSNR